MAVLSTRPTSRHRLWTRGSTLPTTTRSRSRITQSGPFSSSTSTLWRRRMPRSSDPDAVYETLVDTNGDAQPEIVFQCTFMPKNSNGEQVVSVVRSDLTRNVAGGPTQQVTVSVVNNRTGVAHTGGARHPRH